MPRSSWKGYLKLSLVSCAVALYNATSASERVSFNTLNRKTGNRLKQNMVDSVTEEPVDTADRVKGYQVSKGQYVMVEDDDLEALKIESTKMIEIETFVPQAEVDQIYLDSPYYLAPDDKVAEEAFAVIRDAMTRKKMVGIGRVVLSRRERMLMLRAARQGHARDDPALSLRGAAGRGIFRRHLRRRSCRPRCSTSPRRSSSRKSGHFEPDKFTDRYEEAVVEHAARQAGRPGLHGRPRRRRRPTSSTSWTR